MANMKHCRFRNTLQDLKDCYDAAHEYDDGALSKEETTAFLHLIKLCKRIVDDYGDEPDSGVRS